MPIDISVTSDFICPWCYIGEQRLARAMESLPPGIDIRLQWLPFELNPAMPAEGMDRKIYRSQKFGSWERSQAMDAQTVLAGKGEVVFNYETIKRTPNSFLAHRVSWLAQHTGQQQAFVAAALKAYFAAGRDIGSKDVLADIAGEIGLDRAAVAVFLDSNEGISDVRTLERAAHDQGVQGVPHFDIAGIVLAGAQPADIIRRAIIERSLGQS